MAEKRTTILEIENCEDAMYSRTQNDNGTYNTRCLDCFMTIASSVETNQELDLFEVRHVCPERVLSELFKKELLQESLLNHSMHR